MLRPEMDNPKLLLTRPKQSAARFAAELSVDSNRVCISPLLEIVPKENLPDLAQFDQVIFTSVNAVAVAPDGNQRRAFCVGKQTEKAALAKGWRIELVALNADALVAAIRERAVAGSLVHLAGAHRRGEIAERLRHCGMDVSVVTLYEQHLRFLSPKAQSLLAGEAPVIVPLFSARTAAQFVDQAQCLDRAVIVAISATVAGIVKGLPIADMLIAKTPTGEEMKRLVEKLLRKDRLP
ncbi:uroporphyrinogen-III synthase [Sulfitobacter sp. F26204]|uniref:uroporphyrinogen-III synthase n=1 Tax=Sulfitobacter sp. F26204 TaxID=2996014 RepID=UPI00225E531E|nr:uroporphyrinogen-III synthase [Sulfitobacter sp. F26204]MCX7558211.1 uroporphyrinogen-III synthase [Sulfitobacter sp. F26204]